MTLRRQLSLAARRVGLRPAPLDWTRGQADDSAWAAEIGSVSVEVIVPIHGAHDVARQCLESVARHTDLSRHRLTVVVDGDPGFSDDDVRDAVGESSARLTILRHETARGFVASVNHGMSQSDLDVVLLNSDVVVTERWLDKMLEAAASTCEEVAQRIATVTPFSNDATICSVPEPLVHNELPAGHDVESFGRLVERASSRTYPRLPTGVGMCLLIRRAALDELGLFDEEAFGKGYGEETDFCFRARRAGWTHVLDDATFVFHHGQQSFGVGRDERVRRAEKTLARRHPDYAATLDVFLRDDLLGHGPAAQAVRRVRWALRDAATTETPGTRVRARARRVVHLVHGWPPHDTGGTENYARWLVESQRRHRDVAVYARIADPERELGDATDERSETKEGSLRVRLLVNNFTERNPVVRNALDSPVTNHDFARFLDDVEPDLVHVHHLAGHGIGLVRAVRDRGLPLVYQAQDWWALCARANLLQRPGGHPCPGPSLGRCSTCLPLTKLPPAPLLNRALYALRGRLAKRALASADAYVMGSGAIRDDYLAHGLLRPSDAVYVLPYGVARPETPNDRPPTGTPIRLGCVGAVLPHKGLHVAAEAMRDAPGVTLDIWGNDQADPGYARRLKALAPDRVRLRGRFDDDEKDAVFEQMDVLLMPSLGQESFGLVAREALARDVPVVASQLGALAELFDDSKKESGETGEPTCDHRAGELLPPGDVAVWSALFRRLADDPSQVDRWRDAIRPVVGLAEHAEAIEQVYADVLG